MLAVCPPSGTRRRWTIRACLPCSISNSRWVQGAPSPSAARCRSCSSRRSSRQSSSKRSRRIWSHSQLMRPSVRQLECLVATAKHLNFRAAARECHISQPALSAQIARLEELLGVTLFERDRRHVLLTPVGEEVVARARQLLTELDDLGAAAQAHTRPLGGQLRLGVIPTIAPYIMPRALTLIRGACPELEVLLREEQTAR